MLACSSPGAALSAASLDAGASSSGAVTLPAAVVRELFIQLLLLSPKLACADLRALLLQVLQHLVATGGYLPGFISLHTHGSDGSWVLLAFRNQGSLS